MATFKEVAESLGLPVVWFVVLLISIFLLTCLICCCCVRRCHKKRRRKKKKGVDMKDVQLLGAAYKEKAEADLEGLTDNAEETATEDVAKKEVEKPGGRLHYRLDYDYNTGSLNVTVIECDNLPAMDVNGTSDPYVKLYLMPDKKKKFETKVQKRSLNPVFNETFTYKLSYAEIISKTILFAVYDYDRFSKHDLMGHVKVPLAFVDLGQTQDHWRDLEKVEEDTSQLGDICFSIRYVPTTGKLSIVVLEAKNLKKMDIGGASDPYVKLCLYQNGKRIKKKKTSVKKNTLNPYYNESFTFELPFAQLHKTSLQVTVIDYDRIGSSDPIGRVVLGNTASGIQLKHWAEMIANPRRPIAQWHKLQDPDEANVTLATKSSTKSKEKSSTH